jgi:hypothetical protein
MHVCQSIISAAAEYRIEVPCIKLQGNFDCKEFGHFWIRSLTLQQAAGNALTAAVQAIWLSCGRHFDL